ncbi:MAG: NCS2 family permease [Candidatus Brocadiia bacterium]
MGAIARFFRLEQAGTTVGTEVRAGVVTFMTMAYIIFVQPFVLSQAGMDPDGVMMATCLSSALATLTMGLLANYPIALAPAMGHNFYFLFLVTSGLVDGWEQALGAVFVSGLLFLVLSFFGFRERVVNAVPDSLKYAIAVGIGLLIALVGLQLGGLVEVNAENPAATGLRLAEFGDEALLALVGLAVTGSMLAFRVRGAILVGLLATALLGAVMGLVSLPETPVAPPPWEGLRATALRLDVVGALQFGFFGVIFTFFFLDLFDTIGTLIGVTQQAGLMVEGRLPRARRALFSDAVGTVTGSLLGTSTVTSYIESTAGVSEGGRTGLASVVTSVLFLAAMFFSPCVAVIASGVPTDQEFKLRDVDAKWQPGPEAEGPAAKPWQVSAEAEGTLRVGRTKVLNPVTAPILIIVGCLMMTAVPRIRWGDWTEALPAFLAIVMMPLTGNITEGIAFGFIAYALLKTVSGRVKELSPWVAVFAVLFVLRYIYEALAAAA